MHTIIVWKFQNFRKFVRHVATYGHRYFLRVIDINEKDKKRSNKTKQKNEDLTI
jgi:hypothetical protein